MLGSADMLLLRRNAAHRQRSLRAYLGFVDTTVLAWGLGSRALERLKSATCENGRKGDDTAKLNERRQHQLA